jgi:hypothetical protein
MPVTVSDPIAVARAAPPLLFDGGLLMPNE